MDCGEVAVLILTSAVEGTSTTLARKRVELRCGLSAGHQGLHRDAQAGEEWASTPGQKTTLLRDESDEGGSKPLP
jgi:hypothetical protein